MIDERHFNLAEYQSFASKLTDQMESLVGDLNQRVRKVGDYTRYDEAATLELSREDLRLIIACLESGSPDPFSNFVESRG